MHWLALPVCCVSEAGVMVRTYVERSMLVPDHVMTRLMMPRLEQLMGHSWLLDGMNQINLFIFYLFEILFYKKTLYMVCALLLLHTAPPLQCLDLWGNMFFIMQRNGQRWELPPTPRIWLVTPGATPPQTPPPTRIMLEDIRKDFYMFRNMALKVSFVMPPLYESEE